LKGGICTVLDEKRDPFLEVGFFFFLGEKTCGLENVCIEKKSISDGEQALFLPKLLRIIDF